MTERIPGKRAPSDILVDLAALERAYYDARPDPRVSSQRVSFGTSGHRGSSLRTSFNEAHVVAIAQAVVEYRKAAGTTGPLFLGKDTHALSGPAWESVLGVLAAQGVTAMIDAADGFTPTPGVSRAIVAYNQGRTAQLADGLIITPSHNPPEDGGLKYNPPHGGPAGSDATRWIEQRANTILEEGVEVRRWTSADAKHATTTQRYSYIDNYVDALKDVVDMEAIRDAKLTLGVDPMGGSGIAYWAPIAERYGLDIDVVNPKVDPTFSFMTLDADGQIRMDCSSPYAMAGLVSLKERFDIAFGNDPDYDRHGIVTKSGLMNPNHYLAAAINYLFQNRPGLGPQVGIGKTLVSSSMIDRVAESLGRTLCEVPVGFKWFVPGLLDGSLGFGGEESAGATFLTKRGKVWTTDKDGIVMDLLAAEILAVTGRDPAEHYRELEDRFGESQYRRIDVDASLEQKARLGGLTGEEVKSESLAGDPILHRLTRAPGNDQPIGGLKVVTRSGWFAARPSGTEAKYKIYAESLKSKDHLEQLLKEAKALVTSVIV